MVNNDNCELGLILLTTSIKNQVSTSEFYVRKVMFFDGTIKINDIELAMVGILTLSRRQQGTSQEPRDSFYWHEVGRCYGAYRS